MKKDVGEHGLRGSKLAINKAIVSVTLSPRTVAILNESYRLLTLLAVEPIVLHIGEDTPSTRKKIESYLAESFFSAQPPPYLISQGPIVEQMLSVAKKTKADLIIAGALVKEGLLKSTISKVAHQLAMKSQCSILLLVDPSPMPRPLHKILCLVEYSRLAKFGVLLADQIARAAGSNELLYMHVFRFPKEIESGNSGSSRAAKIRHLYHQQDLKLHRYLERVLEDSRYRVQCVHEQSRAATLEFIKEFGADLLILPRPRQTEGLWSHIFASDFEMILQNLPCSLLITKKSCHR